jgi:hypothetical protein
VSRERIEKTLPGTADKRNFWDSLEQIKRTKTPPGKLAAQCEEIARRLDEIIPAHHAAVIERLKEHSNDLKKMAATYRRVSEAGGFRFLRQCQLLWLWEMSGGDLGISTPRRRKHERLKEREKQRPPYGPVIAYFQAASEVIFGTAPAPGHIKKVVACYRRAAVRAAYNARLFRTALFGVPLSDERQIRMFVDESKLYILRDGKLIDKDGNSVG